MINNNLQRERSAVKCLMQIFFIMVCSIFFISVASAQQHITVQGKVSDAIGLQIANVNIRSSTNPNIGTTTDELGMYEIKVNPLDSLIFTHISYEAQTVGVLGNTTINISMVAESGSLQDVTIVGFGRQKKISLVGSQATVKPEELKLPVRTISAALGGRIAGVVGVQRSGTPGSDHAEILIRGISTFASSPQGPLVVVDGVPGRSMNNIDPEDVESFTVLKDATATAVYGTRGANGVLLIETKKGKTGKPIVNIEINKAITKFTQLPEFVDAPTYMNLYNEGLVARGRQATFQDSIIARHLSGEDPDLYPNVNWFDVLFNPTGSNERVNVNVRGGAPSARYYIAAGYYGEYGLFKRDDIASYNSSLRFNRFTFLSNVDVDVTKTTKLQLGISGAVENNNFGGTSTPNIFNAATKTPPHLIPPVYSNGQAPQVIGGGGASVSPFIMMTQYGYSTQYNNTVRSNINLTQKLDFLLHGLSARVLFSYDSYNWNRISRVKQPQTYFAEGRDSEGNLITSIILPSTNVLGFAATRGGGTAIFTQKQHLTTIIVLINMMYPECCYSASLII